MVVFLQLNVITDRYFLPYETSLFQEYIENIKQNYIFVGKTMYFVILNTTKISRANKYINNNIIYCRNKI